MFPPLAIETESHKVAVTVAVVLTQHISYLTGSALKLTVKCADNLQQPAKKWHLMKTLVPPGRPNQFALCVIRC